MNDTNNTVLTPRPADINAIMMDLRDAFIDVTIHQTSANLLCNYIETLERSRIQPAASDAETPIDDKAHPRFMAGYAAGLKDGRACERRDASEAGAVPVAWMLEHNLGRAPLFCLGGNDPSDAWGEKYLPLYPAPPSAPPAQPEKQAGQTVAIPLELANRIGDALGRFTSDEGWTQADMDTADDLSALLAAPPAPSQQAAPAAEPVAIVNEVGGVDWMPGRCSSMRVGDVLYDGPVPAAESAMRDAIVTGMGVMQGDRHIPIGDVMKPTAATAPAQFSGNSGELDAQGDEREENLLDYAMQIAHERELEVTGHKHDSEGAVRRFKSAVDRALSRQPSARQWPPVTGVGRDASHPRAIMVYLSAEPRDDDLRNIQAALSGQPPAPASAEDEFYWILVSEPGKVVVRKGGWTDSKFVEQMLRELYAAKPDATCIVVKGPYHLYGTDGREWVSMYGDRRRKPIPRAALAAAKPEGGSRE